MKNNELIKVGLLVSYDYKYLQYALPPIYEHADIIALAIDKNRLTWSGEKFDLPDSFFEWVKEFDTQNKIRLYEDVFCISDLTTMECETRERNMLGVFLGEGGWHVQLDSDEYFIDFKGFVDYLRTLDFNTKMSVYGQLITIFKQNKTENFLIDSKEVFPLANNNPQYTSARCIDEKTNKVIHTSFKVLHQSWGRTTEELQQKLSNWGHNTDFDINSYFNLWNVINKHTYRYLRDFHPLQDFIWHRLEYVEANDISDLLEKIKVQQEQKRIEEKQSFFKRLFSKKK